MPSVEEKRNGLFFLLVRFNQILTVTTYNTKK